MMHLTKTFEHLKIQLQAIESATNNFADDNCIGKGGFGKVYKGELVHSKGRTVVALKRLDRTFGQGNPEFWKEVIMLSLYKHENIVSLLGFCDESNEKILVYEYASRKSLDLYLNNDDLTWTDRIKICIGAARGLAYLHNPGETQQRVLHRDIKSSNILLDENWNAKISDLGLSKFGPANQQYTFIVSNVVGTIGYCDPLYIESGLLTKESDVYSFGIVLFEVLCGRLCISHGTGIHQSLVGLVRQYYKQNKINEIIYGNIKDEMTPKSLDAFTKIAYRCLERELEERPLMTEVVRILESVLEYQSGNTSKTVTMETRSQYFLSDAMPSSSVVKSINPTNPEMADRVANANIFEMYFKIADLDKDGRVNGVEAVRFFQTSGLPKAILAQIWTYADKNQNGYLNREEFDNYLKLVTVAQGKRELTPDIVKAALYGPISPKIHAPKINLAALATPQQNLNLNDGISLKMATTETRSKNPLLDTIASNSATYDVNPSHPEMGRRVANTNLFEMYFKRADSDKDGCVSGAEALLFFQASGLPKSVLAHIWECVDTNQNGYLSREEFHNYLKLVTVAQSKRELTPDMVKAALYGPASAKIPAPNLP